ncbi:MAG: ATP-binding protein [Pseudomonadota bacterium]|nr:ATP-binding protein [Pseudomonadota bacterium]
MCCEPADRKDDPSKRARAVELRHEAEQLVAAHVASLSLNLFVDRTYVCRHVNCKYLDYWQRRREDVIDHRVAEIVGVEVFQNQVKPLLDRALAGESSSRFAASDCPGRGRRHMEVTYLPVRDAAGGIVGVLISCHDVTPLIERSGMLADTVTALEQNAQAQQRFIHVMAHDLREPVNTIVNFALLLLRDGSSFDPKERQDLLARVLRGGQRLQALINDLIELVRLEAKQMPYEEIDLNLLVNDVCSDLAHAIARSDASIDVRRLPTVSGERHLLGVLLQNLLSNAIKFSRKDVAPDIRISAKSSSTEYQICVDDNGIGIPPGQAEGIFEMFHRLHNRKDYDGTGLGLNICRRIVELHGGRIWVTARQGGGSSFYVALPRHEHQPAEM